MAYSVQAGQFGCQVVAKHTSYSAAEPSGRGGRGQVQATQQVIMCAHCQRRVLCSWRAAEGAPRALLAARPVRNHSTSSTSSPRCVVCVMPRRCCLRMRACALSTRRAGCRSLGVTKWVVPAAGAQAASVKPPHSAQVMSDTATLAVGRPSAGC